MPVGGFSFTAAPGHYRVVPPESDWDHMSIALAATGCILLCTGLLTRRRPS